MEMARFAEPIDKFVMADWQGAEIYEAKRISKCTTATLL